MVAAISRHSPTSNAVSGTDEQPAESLSATETRDLQNALLQNELQRRQLIIQNARLANELRTARQAAGIREVSGPNLVEFRSLRARVLSHSGTPQRLTQMIIDAGKSEGLRPSELVVNSSGFVIDQGLDSAVQNGQKVAAGLTVVGRIVQVTRWISVVQPVTDKDFSAAVQIVRMAPHGALFGAKGLLVSGENGTCRVTGIPHTEAVSVGDEVFTADINGIHGPRLYFGTVTAAEFSSGGEWTITVSPAAVADNLSEVSIIQPTTETSTPRR